MKKLFAFTLMGSSLLFSGHHAKADWDTYGVNFSGSTSLTIKKCVSSTGNCTTGGSRTSTYMSVTPSESWVDEENNLILVIAEQRTEADSTTNKLLKFDGKTDTFTDLGANWRANDFNGVTFNKFAVQKNSDGSVQIGTDANDVDITAEGISIDGDPLISKKDNGELHIGKNSWITKEENGKQKVYAKDANGNPIPIDYTNGTKLLINGRDIEQSINNVGALSAALTGLPTVPTDTTLACGLGTGTHGGDFAFSGGCASKVNEKLSINYAASITMPGQDYAGDFEDKFSARAGFVWKLGKSNQPTQISIKTKEKMEEKIYSLEEKNEKILSKNKKLENKVSSLIARLERLEKVALGESKSKDLATMKLP